jgi:class 3 adenylate cyclase/tetratricopeptide (TPR) repeat protein
MTQRGQTVTILFTDLVGSTELLQRAGDEQAQRIFKAHHRLLREAVKAHGGDEVKWLGDGLMVAFDSAVEAVKCAIAMQQSSRRPTAGERLEIRAGLNVGEAFIDESDYFGTSVVIARRLCDRGEAGQILASDIVIRLLDERGNGIQTKDLGALELKGITNAVPALEIIYQQDPMALLRKLPFVGRDAEYEMLLKKLAEARNGRGSIVLLAGEPGIGKTRLTEEFCEHAAGSATIIRGNCYDGEVAAPFAPWTQALRLLLEQTPESELRETLGPGAPDIVPILPDIVRKLPDLEESPRLDPEAERARLFDSIGAFVRNAAEKRPLVIFFDDLHWCDRPSLALLEQVARTAAERSTLIVGTYRDVEVDRVHALAGTLADLRRMEHHERLAIRGFTPDSVYDLLTAIEPSEAAAAGRQALARVLHEESNGNPFFLREVLTNLIETGKLVQQDGVWTATVNSVEEMGIPEGIKEVIGRRLSRLSDACNRMLQRASAITGDFTWDELRAICDDTEDMLLDALDEALASQLIEERSRNHYAFTHALVRATLYDELSTPRRIQLHRRVAESLESLYADDLDEHLGELAAHYMASSGGDAQKAVDYSIRAGDRAKSLFAWEEAAAHYRRALEAMAMSGVKQDESRCATLLSLADCQYALSRFAESIESVREAGRLAGTLGSAGLLVRAALTFEEAIYYVDDDALRLGLTEEGVALLDAALALLEDGETATKARVMSRRVRASLAMKSASGSAVGFLAFAGDKDPEELARAREAVDLVTRTGNDEAIVEVCHVLANYSWTPDNLDERRDLAARSFASASRIGTARALNAAYMMRSAVLLEEGDIPGFRDVASEWNDLSLRTRDPFVGAYASPPAITLDVAEGRLSEAERHWTEYARAFSGISDAAVIAGAQLAVIRWLQGRSHELEPMWRPLVERFPHAPVYPATLASMKAGNDEHAEAVSIIHDLIAGDARRVPRDFVWKGTMTLLAEACAESADVAAAAPLYDAIEPRAASIATVAHVVAYGSMGRVAGSLATTLERYDDAERHFETALASNDRMGFHAWTAWTRLNYGDMLLRRDRPGDRERAAALLRQAHDFARDSGMAKVQRDSERLLAGLAAPA